MPVTLPPEQTPEPRPKPPRLVVWLGLLIVIMVFGVVNTLLTWPKNEPTGTAWFWIRMLVIPPICWSIVFGLRLYYYEQECERIDADNETLREDRKKALRFAGEPLAVAGYTYLCGEGNRDVSSKVAEGSVSLESQTSQDGSDSIRHSAITLGDDEGSNRYEDCFKRLISVLKPTIAAIPRDVPFGVRLQLPDNPEAETLRQTWQTCWDEQELRNAKAMLMSEQQGVMALDEWLDIRGGPALEKFLLFVAVQLHDTPPQNSAEAAVGMVVGWAPLARRRDIPVIVHLHRPVEAVSGSTDTPIAMALQWGGVAGKQIRNLWHAGLEGADKGALGKSMSDLSIGVSQTENLSGIHDIDTALGHPGNVAGWLTLALATEFATQNNKPQLAAWREGTLRFAVAQPVVPIDNSNSNA